MTKEETKYAVEVMQAYIDGKEIEYSSIGQNEWYLVNNPMFDWDTFNYRIKQEQKYRPFKNKEECWNEMQKHQPFGWVKNTGFLTCLTSIGDTTDFNYAYEVLCFADGTPFGIMEE